MKRNLYYKKRNGIWIERFRIEEAFYLDFGYYPIFGTEREFLTWLYEKLGKTIMEVRKENDPYLIDELIKGNQRVLAIKLVHQQFGFDLTKAREIVNEAEAKFKMETTIY
jgi:hypothetical protein